MKNFYPYYILATGALAFINGILHDIFVLKKHPVYDRKLIKLLVDGHILIFGGIFYLMAYAGLKNME